MLHDHEVRRLLWDGCVNALDTGGYPAGNRGRARPSQETHYFRAKNVGFWPIRALQGVSVENRLCRSSASAD